MIASNKKELKEIIENDLIYYNEVLENVKKDIKELKEIKKQCNNKNSIKDLLEQKYESITYIGNKLNTYYYN